MPRIHRFRPQRRTSLWLLLGLLAATALGGCQTPIDVTRVSGYTGTLGEEIHTIFCKRFASEAYPNDVSGILTKDLCEGRAQPTADTPPRLAGIVEERPRLAPALDAIMPVDTHSDLYDLLQAILPLYDDGTLPGQTRALDSLLVAISNDAQAPNTFARISHHQGYRPLQYGLGIARPALGYPKLHDVIANSLAALDVGGVGHDAFGLTLRGGALEMATLAPTAATDLPSNVTLARQLLLTQNPVFAASPANPRYFVLRDVRGVALPTGVTGTGTVPAPFVDKNGDHLPDVDSLDRYLGANGTPLALPTPFAIDQEVLPAGATRDAQGRALMGGTLVYQYQDFDTTMAAALLREAAPWVRNSSAASPATLAKLSRALPIFLGPQATLSRAYGQTTLSYGGYDPTTGPAYDLLHATFAVMQRAPTVDLLSMVSDLLANQESLTADLIEAGLDGKRRADAHPEAALAQPNIFWDELLAPVERMSQIPGMMEAVLRSLDTDAARDLDDIVALYANNRDAISVNQTVDPGPVGSGGWNDPIPQGALTNPVDRTKTDADPANESLLQRSVYLIRDLDGVQYCNKAGAHLIMHLNWSDTLYADGTGLDVNNLLSWTGLVPASYARCELFQIDNVAKAYTQSIWQGYEFKLNGTVGTLMSLLSKFMPSLANATLENTTQIKGMGTYPTAPAMARFVFAAHNNSLRALVDDLTAIDGADIEDRHCIGRGAGIPSGGVRTPCPSAIIFAWEKPVQLPDGRYRSFLDALQGTLRAINDKEAATDFFFGAISNALHRHWPTRMATRTQDTNPTATGLGTIGFSYQDNIRSYEPLVGEIFQKERLIHRLSAVIDYEATLTTALPSGTTNHVQALAAAVEGMTNPLANCVGSCTTGSLTYRDGRNYITWNDGTKWNGTGGHAQRYPSPMYLLLDALHGADAAWVGNDARHQSWLAARSTIVDQLFTTEVVGGQRRLKDRRALGILQATVPFLQARIVAHRTGTTPDATARTWAKAREKSMTDTLSGPLVAGLVSLLDSLDQDPAARDSLLGLIAQLLDEGASPEGVTAMLYALTDALQVLDDDAHVVPLVNVLSRALATNAQDVVANGGTVDESTSVASLSIPVLNRISAQDTNAVLTRVLGHAVELPSTGAPITRLETVMDVIAEVNRTTPVAGGPVDDQDVKDILASIEEFLSSSVRGLERLYAVIEHRKVTP